MTADVYNDTWASLVVWLKRLMPDMPFHDWEAHSATPELPNTDLVGIVALTVTEYEDKVFEANFSVGISTYGKDQGLFRLRGAVGKVFSAMQSQQQIPYYDTSDNSEASTLVMTPGTMVAPMNTVQIRPFQYVQGSALLLPRGTDA